MEKLKNIFSNIYANEQSMIYFYLILGVIALFFIILIVVTLLKSKKDDNKNIEVKEQKEVILEEKIEEKQLPQEEIKLTETQVFNNILMNQDAENNSNEMTLPPKIEELKEMKEEFLDGEETKAQNNEEIVYIERNTEIDEPKVEEIVSNENDVTIEEVIPEVIEDTIEPLPNLDEANITSLDDVQNELDSKEELTLKTADIDEFLLDTIDLEAIKNVDLNQNIEVVTEEAPKTTIYTNEELKERLAKLKNKNKEISQEDTISLTQSDEIPDADLEDLMKSVGLEDTMVIPTLKEEESHILGR